MEYYNFEWHLNIGLIEVDKYMHREYSQQLEHAVPLQRTHRRLVIGLNNKQLQMHMAGPVEYVIATYGFRGLLRYPWFRSKLRTGLFLRAMVNGWEKESMTLFEVDRVFWTCQDFCLGSPKGSPKGSPRQKSSCVQKTLSRTHYQGT